MIRIFNHYLHRSALLGMLFDLGLVLVVALVAVASQASNVGQVPFAGTHIVSFAACLFVINSASGLYEPSAQLSFSRSVARALLVLLVALPLAYAIFGLLPDGFANRQAIQASMMAGVAALILRRAYMSHSSVAASARTRILIFGVGPAAAVVGKTLKASDPNAHIVGYVAGPNEKEPAVKTHELLALTGTLTETARRLGVDEIVVALTERRAGSMPLRQLLDCKASGIKVQDLNTHFEKTLGQIRIDYLNASWLIFGDGFNQGSWRTFVKRVFDIVCASVLCMLAAPVMAVTAVIIKLESAGPALYRQERVGLNGRLFKS
jgi:FlaA1/EpsC-like NDP-sugar epimerase